MTIRNFTNHNKSHEERKYKPNSSNARTSVRLLPWLRSLCSSRPRQISKHISLSLARILWALTTTRRCNKPASEARRRVSRAVPYASAELHHKCQQSCTVGVNRALPYAPAELHRGRQQRLTVGVSRATPCQQSCTEGVTQSCIIGVSRAVPET